MHKVSLKRAYILCLSLILGSFCVTQAASDNPNNYQWPLSNQATSVFMCPLCENPSNSEFHKDFCTINNQPIMPLSTYPLSVSHENADIVTCPLCEHPFNSIHHDISCNLTQPAISTNTITLLPDQPNPATTAAPWCNTCNRSAESGYHELICARFPPTMPPQNQQPINPLLQANQALQQEMLRQEADADQELTAEAAAHEEFTETNTIDSEEEYDDEQDAESDTNRYFLTDSTDKTQSKTVASSAQLTKQKRAYTCEMCEKTFGGSEHLKAHRRIHTGERPYLCTICQKRFTQPSILKTHMRSHTGEKPYLCTWPGCTQACITASHLKRHVRTHTGEKPYQCCNCDNAFTDNRELKKHYDKTPRCKRALTHNEKKPIPSNDNSAAVHSSSKEATCSKSKTQAGPHEVTHTHQKSYACTWEGCTKTYSQAGGLKIHIRTHTGEKPYVCTLCNKEFINQGRLKTHESTKKHLKNVTLTQSSAQQNAAANSTIDSSNQDDDLDEQEESDEDQ